MASTAFSASTAAQSPSATNNQATHNPAANKPTNQANRNRANAQHSTGPRTAQGKARSADNARTHGLAILHHRVLPHEDQAAYDQFLASLHETYVPQSPRETLAVHQIAESRWALRRFDEAEALHLAALFDPTLSPPAHLPTLDLLLRYRRHWDRRLREALQELDRAARHRRAEAREHRAEAKHQRAQERHRRAEERHEQAKARHEQATERHAQQLNSMKFNHLLKAAAHHQAETKRQQDAEADRRLYEIVL